MESFVAILCPCLSMIGGTKVRINPATAHTSDPAHQKELDPIPPTCMEQSRHAHITNFHGHMRSNQHSIRAFQDKRNSVDRMERVNVADRLRTADRQKLCLLTQSFRSSYLYNVQYHPARSIHQSQLSSPLTVDAERTL